MRSDRRFGRCCVVEWNDTFYFANSHNHYYSIAKQEEDVIKIREHALHFEEMLLRYAFA